MSDKDDTPESPANNAGAWTSAAALAGAAIGSAAVAAALLYNSRRKERADKAKATPPVLPTLPPETD